MDESNLYGKNRDSDLKMNYKQTKGQNYAK